MQIKYWYGPKQKKNRKSTANGVFTGRPRRSHWSLTLAPPAWTWAGNILSRAPLLTRWGTSWDGDSLRFNPVELRLRKSLGGSWALSPGNADPERKDLSRGKKKTREVMKGSGQGTTIIFDKRPVNRYLGLCESHGLGQHSSRPL